MVGNQAKDLEGNNFESVISYLKYCPNFGEI
jgi:hypothetical protein